MKQFSDNEQSYMALALELADRGRFSTRPNPQVGCVLVKAGEIVGQGWHQRAGEPHAEVFALRQAAEQANGASAYINLEPCAHHGRTPPCADALITAGIKRVVVAMEDPYHQVAGEGLKRLRAAGIEVETGLLEAEARWQNRGFISRCERQRPWVRVKLASSLDGRTALANGQSQWITSAEARADGHQLRARSGAVITGIGTVLADKPRLTARVAELEQQPLRVILDSNWQTPVTAPMFNEAGRVLIVGAQKQAIPEQLQQHCKANGHQCLAVSASASGIDLGSLVEHLSALEINEIHVEAGAKLAGAFMQAGLVDELVVYLAPKVLGEKSRGLVVLPEFLQLDEAPQWQWQDIRPIGTDIRLTLTES